MSFRFELMLSLLITAAVYTASRRAAADTPHLLRVCADPNNLPFSNQRAEGFENRIASVIGRDLDLSVRYTWWPHGRGLVQNALNAGRCDMIMGVPPGFEGVVRTSPYYRSTYVFVTRRDQALQIRSLDDSVLHRLRIGVHLLADDHADLPPAQALARRGLSANVIGYNLYGDSSKPNPPGNLIRAVARGEVDVAIAWGPLAGYFAHRVREPLELVPVTAGADLPSPAFVLAIAAGVRRGDTQMRDRIQAALDRHRDEIRDILQSYGVPLMPPAARP